MSDATKAAMEVAIEAHMADEHDATVIMTGYLLQAVGVAADPGADLPREPLIYCGKENQSGVITMGLLAYMNYNAEGTTFEGDDEDDDD